MKKKVYILLTAAILACAVGIGWYVRSQHGISQCSLSQMESQAFKALRVIRQSKKQQIITHFQRLRSKAGKMSSDKVITRLFAAYSKGKSALDDKQELVVDRHYVTHYGDFYDLLFIDTEGYVFHSIRKEDDYHTNILTGDSVNTRLAQQLKAQGQESFVDYEFYIPSDEPAAFFVVPIYMADVFQGSVVLQCALNRLNALLADYKLMGRTGEIYLVNEDRLMVTQSRFLADSSILQLKVETEAVRKAFDSGTGEGIIADYRGIRVFSSFERFDMFDNSWIVVAERDESEILTEYYREHKETLLRQMLLQLLSTPSPGTEADLPDSAMRVDMNETRKGVVGESLMTHGVSACTAVAITRKGEWGYLAHISPRDVVYGVDSDLKFFDEVIHRILYNEVKPVERGDLQYTIVAPHFESIELVLDRILETGVSLSNVAFLLDTKALCVNASLNPDNGVVLSQWVYDSQKKTKVVRSSDVADLGAVLKQVLNGEDS